MNWFYPPTLLDFGFGALLVLALLLWVAREWWLGRALGQSARAVAWKLPLRLLAGGLLLIGLLGPALGTTRKQVRSTGKDVWLMVDLSRSMDAQDVRPTRLERVKALLPGLLNASGADRAALVAFAGDAQVRCPLTFDQQALLLYVATLRTDQPTVPGTDVGAALDTVRLKIRADAAGQSATGNVNSPVVVLITDGEDFGTGERNVATALARDRVPVFVLGVGTPGGAPVPGAHRPRGDDETGPPISRLQPEGLRPLAEITGGRYFELTDYTDDTRELTTALAALRGQVREVKQLQVAANKYQYPLWLALALLVVDVLVTVRVFRLD